MPNKGFRHVVGTFEHRRDELIVRKNAQYPTRDAVESEWAWAAGVYEGEGSAAARPGRLEIMIVQKDPHILHKLKQFCGGRISERHVGYKPNEACFCLAFAGHNARRFVRHTWKWLSPRRQEQIERYASIDQM